MHEKASSVSQPGVPILSLFLGRESTDHQDRGEERQPSLQRDASFHKHLEGDRPQDFDPRGHSRQVLSFFIGFGKAQHELLLLLSRKVFSIFFLGLCKLQQQLLLLLSR
jgi:hypothetical protein